MFYAYNKSSFLICSGGSVAAILKDGFPVLPVFKVLCDIINYGPFLKKNRVTLSRPWDNSQTNHPIPILKKIFGCWTVHFFGCATRVDYIGFFKAWAGRLE
jgi:hypothetical protein